MHHVWPMWGIGILFLVLYSLSWIFIHLLYNGFLDPEVKVEEKPEGLEPMENAKNWLLPMNEFEKWYYENSPKIWWENLPRHIHFDIETYGTNYDLALCRSYAERDLKYTEELLKNHLENYRNKKAYVPNLKEIAKKHFQIDEGKKGLEKPEE